MTLNECFFIIIESFSHVRIEAFLRAKQVSSGLTREEFADELIEICALINCDLNNKNLHRCLITGNGTYRYVTLSSDVQIRKQEIAMLEKEYKVEFTQNVEILLYKESDDNVLNILTKKSIQKFWPHLYAFRYPNNKSQTPPLPKLSRYKPVFEDYYFVLPDSISKDFPVGRMGSVLFPISLTYSDEVQIRNTIPSKRPHGFGSILTDIQRKESFPWLIKQSVIDSNTKEHHFEAMLKDEELPSDFEKIKFILMNPKSLPHKTALRELITIISGKVPTQSNINDCISDANGQPIELAKPKAGEFTNYYEVFEKMLKF